jgi:tRNA/tmRNA/rRNA uracil-C5-methylase (TrmA/RlmC/RlmD family)
MTDTQLSQPHAMPTETVPLCPVFGVCGGCEFQNIPYDQELRIKDRRFRELFVQELQLPSEVFAPMVASPLEYYYRSRLDLTMRRVRGELMMGFQREDTHRMVLVEACPIARKEISDFIPSLRREAAERMPPDYRVANLTVRTDDTGRVFWGGIGRRSLEMKPDDYFYTEIHGKRMFYSLDTFFQANLAILPLLMDTIAQSVTLDCETVFYDLYAGVGLFGIYFADRVGRTVIMESNVPSVKLMQKNIEQHSLKNVEIFGGRVEEGLPTFLAAQDCGRKVAMIDPPRKGLSFEAADALSDEKRLDTLLYLSCSTASLVRDLRHFIRKGWTVQKLTPFDFFPKTKHLETLAILRPEKKGALR